MFFVRLSVFFTILVVFPVYSAEWVVSDRFAFEQKEASLRLRAKHGTHWNFYNKPIALPYEISFTENTGKSSGLLKILWNLDHDNTTKTRKTSTGYYNQIELQNGRGTYIYSVFNQKKLAIPPGKRKWRIVTTKNHVTVFLNGRQIIQEKIDNGKTITPSVAIAVQNLSGTDFQVELENFQIRTQAGGSRPEIISLPLDRSRKIIVVSEKKISPDHMKFYREIASITSIMENMTVPISHTDIVIGLYKNTLAANNLGAAKGYPGWIIVPESMKGNHFSLAHEIAHYYLFMGAGSSMGNATMVSWHFEGYASFLAGRAINEFEGKPLDRMHIDHLNNLYGIGRKGKLVAGGYNDPPLDLGNEFPARHLPPGADKNRLAIGVAYGKSYIFFQILQEIAGFKCMAKIVEKNYTKNDYRRYTTNEMLIDLSDCSGKDLEFLKPGWIVPGKYNNITPLDAQDSNANGVLDFREKIENGNS